MRILSARLWLTILLLLCAVLAGFWLWLRSSLPVTDRRLTLSGLAAETRITRDADGVATIVAQNDPDAAFALGYLHAQDRLFQMDLMRRYGAGRLAEWFGARALETDRMTRTLGLYRAAEQQYARLSPELRAVFAAYAAGVNALITARQRALPPEYYVLAARPEPWQPADSLVWGKIMDLQLTANYRGELLRARLAQRLKPEELAVLYPDYPADAPVALGDLHALLEGLPLDRLYAGLPPGIGPLPASNEWVVDSAHSVAGKPLLANDTHLGFAAPGVWYLARIETPDEEIAGVTAPGTPFIVIGHNRHIAWGFTTTGGDVEDLFVEKPDPADPSHYLAPEGSLPFVTRQEQILVRNAPPSSLTIRATRHGPVISDLAYDSIPGGPMMALQATWLRDDDITPQAVWAMTRAHDWAGFRAALRDMTAPQQNIAYADIDGNIGFLAPARIPIRASGNGWLPVPGWTADYDWTGYVPFDEMPMAFNPPSGRVVTANNKIVPDSYPYFITRDWELPYRAERITELLDATPQQSPDASAAIQRDDLSLMAKILVPLMVEMTPSSPIAADAIRRLKAWDGRMGRDQIEPLYFVAWLRQFNRQILADKLGPVFEDYWGLHPDVIANILTQHRDWCDNRDTPVVETCAEQLSAALDRALDELARRYGDISGWSWGRAHPALFENPLWSHVPVLRDWLGLAIPDDGSLDTVDTGAMIIGDPELPFAARHGPVMRMIVDLAAPDSARFMIVPGQSGNPLSPHYGDLLERWRDTRSLAFSDDASGGVLILAPR